ncbi:hypothetical protein HYFRA_00006851 [Hymenoscyphus fraxineus]|uniref:Uncharacterized protein n=1 Tax=Hymenoscyphus fraxineus TaxID=746836 RepID=A0A9N9KNT4_9HELO|nr:hypothetical protein HYFRA_00006851 [Hymenoscyphus fraxineus]
MYHLDLRTISGPEQIDVIHVIVIALFKARQISILSPEELVLSDTMEEASFQHEPTPEIVSAQEHFGKLQDMKLMPVEERRHIREILFKFHIARHHCFTVGHVTGIAWQYPELFDSDETCTKIHRTLNAQVNDYMRASLDFLKEFVTRVIEKCEEVAGAGFWANCSSAQQREIFGRIYGNNPMYLLTRLHRGESKVVAFTELFVSDSPERVKWRRFFRQKFINMACMVSKTREADQLRCWFSWPESNSLELGSENPFALPAVATVYRNKKARNDEEELDTGDYNASKRRKIVLGT